MLWVDWFAGVGGSACGGWADDNEKNVEATSCGAKPLAPAFRADAGKTHVDFSDK